MPPRHTEPYRTPNRPKEIIVVEAPQLRRHENFDDLIMMNSSEFVSASQQSDGKDQEPLVEKEADPKASNSSNQK